MYGVQMQWKDQYAVMEDKFCHPEERQFDRLVNC